MLLKELINASPLWGVFSNIIVRFTRNSDLQRVVQEQLALHSKSCSLCYAWECIATHSIEATTQYWGHRVTKGTW